MRNQNFKLKNFLNQTLDIGIYTKAINQIRPKNVKLCGVFGDPLANNKILEYIDICVNNNIYCEIVTNTTLGNLQVWKKILFYSEKYNLKLILSIDGHKKTNHIYRKNASWDNIEKRLNLINGKVHNCIIKFINFKHNQKDKINLIKLANKKNLKFTEVPLLQKNTMIEKLTENNNYFFNKLLTTYNMYNNYTCSFKKNNNLFLDVKGNLWPCFHHFDHYLRFEHIDTKSYNSLNICKYGFLDILEGEIFKNLLNHQVQSRCGVSCGDKSFYKWKKLV